MARERDSVPTRATLLELIRDSADADAWRRFEATYREMLLRFGRSRGLQHADAEDVVQVVFAKLVSGLRRFEYDPARGRFRDYLFRCVRSAMADLGRCPEPRGSEVLPDSGSRAEDPADESRFEQEWVAHHYRLAIAGLRGTVEPASIDVFQALLDGRSVREVAVEKGMGEAAVYKVQQRMRERLRERIAEQVREEDRAGA